MQAPTKTPAPATRDTILAADPAILTDPARGIVGAYVTGDEGADWRVIGQAEDKVTLYAISERSGTVVAVRQTGKRVVKEQVRVRVYLPRDTGDMAGTVAFDQAHTGGFAPARLFE